ncbi:hypothetical protein ACQV2B_18985 [Pantoea allii]|uniref:hypothetical protein n=1 Tax=Pantoea allii TaxID=574096 RepID=UPI003D30F23B
MGLNVHHIQTDFTGGELDPMLLGRVNADRYGVAAKELTNMWVRVSGGAEGRAGLRFVNKARDNTGDIRLIPWVYNRDQSYVLELTDNKMRFIQQGQFVTKTDGTIYEIDTGIPKEALATVRFAQRTDTLIFAHPTFAPKKLVRNDQLDWTMSTITFEVIPFDELSNSPTGWAVVASNDYVAQSTTITLKDGPDNNNYSGTGFTSDMVNSYVRVYEGLYKITGVSSNSVAQVQIRTLMTVAPTKNDSTGKTWPPAPVDNWKVLKAMWSDTLGWPSCVCFHQQRLVFAGSNKYPQWIWGSGIRQFYNFELGSLGTSAWAFQLDSNQINPILHLFSMNALIALTSMNEFLITSSTGVITPTSVNVRCPSEYGANPVLPVRMATDLLYLQRGSHKLLTLNYDPDNQTGYTVNELSLLAEHMLESPIVDMTVQAQPRNRIHMLRLDGQMVTLTVNKQVGIAAWSRVVTDGSFLTCATIPREDGTDDTYVAVVREIGGTPQVYIEHFQEGIYSDSALVGAIEKETDPPQQKWTKLEHLEGKTVAIVADGSVQTQQVVKDGAVTLARPARQVVIGLPYTPRLIMLPPEAQMQTGTMQGSKVALKRLRIRINDTTGMMINGQQVPFRKFGLKVLDQPSPLYSGDIDWNVVGWNNTETIIEQPQPLPIHVLAVVRSLTVNN